jgi:hypothetical protein
MSARNEDDDNDSDEGQVVFIGRNTSKAMQEQMKYWEVPTPERRREKAEVLEKVRKELEGMLEGYEIEKVLKEDELKDSTISGDRKCLEVAELAQGAIWAVQDALVAPEEVGQDAMEKIMATMDSLKRGKRKLPVMSEE